MRDLKDVVLENWGLKVISLLLAVTLWFAVHGDPATEKTITVPVEIHNLRRNFVITSEQPQSVQVTYRGGGPSVWFGESVPVCVIDLSDADEGEHIIPLGTENLRLPRGLVLEVLAVHPARVHLTLEKTASKEVPILAVVTGEPAAGFEVYEIAHSPPRTTITGPWTRVEKVSEVMTEALSIQGKRESVHLLANLNIKDSLIHSSPPSQVEVKVEIGARRRRITIHEVPVLPDDTSLIVTPSRVSIQVLVPETFAGVLTAADFNATVSARKVDLTLPVVKVRPDISFAHPMQPGIKVEDVHPSLVTLHRMEKS